MLCFVRNTLFLLLCFILIFSNIKCDSEEKTKKESPPLYKNLAEGVKYVGISKCRQCHYDKWQTFIETGMGKSFDFATRSKSSAKFTKHSVVYDKFSDLYYHPLWHGDTMKILEFRIEGKDTVHKRIEKVDYIIGSGHHTNSHIYSTNGYLCQMPITFYTQEGKWDLPPGFENGFNSRFSRKIGLECISCHNSHPEFVLGSENKFTHVPNGIDCERCHGPGEVHVKEKEAGIVIDTSKFIDYTIVNPAKLPIDLQFDICQRCHLQGNTVLKDGKSFYDFKPGMKLSEVITVFLPKYENAEDEFIMASHADRLKQSQCFIKSYKEESHTLRPYKEALTCVTCHNPHVSVKATGKEFFNNLCKNCHGNKIQKTCTEKSENRNSKHDNCVSCHMPKSNSIDIPHVTITDHFIRKPKKSVDITAIKKFIGLFAINEKNTQPATIAQAYINQYERFDKNPSLLDSALKYLKDTTLQNIHLFVHIYFLKKDFSKILLLEPKIKQLNPIQNGKPSYDNKDAWLCYRIADAYSAMEKTTEAILYYKKATELAPFNYEFQNRYAGHLVQDGKIQEAKKIYEFILKENPEFAPALNNMGYIYYQKGDKKTALMYYNKAIALEPDYEQALLNKAALMLSEKKFNEAITLAKRVLKRNSRNEYARAIMLQYANVKM